MRLWRSLFGSPGNALVTLFLLACLYLLGKPLVLWAMGAGWWVVGENLRYFFVGQLPRGPGVRGLPVLSPPVLAGLGSLLLPWAVGGKGHGPWQQVRWSPSSLPCGQGRIRHPPLLPSRRWDPAAGQEGGSGPEGSLWSPYRTWGEDLGHRPALQRRRESGGDCRGLRFGERRGLVLEGMGADTHAA